VPDSRLIVVTVPEGQTQTRLRERFEAAGVAASRLELHGLLPLARYEALHSRVDLALDSFPCNGATTTVDTLWQGVPVLALAGDSFRSRNSLSILTCAGLPELIADNEAAYLEIACRFAADPSTLDRLRRDLTVRVAASPLRDEAGFVAELAALLRGVASPVG